MEISKGKKPSAQKIVLFAPEGWGKSTAASKMPSPLFLDTEGSTKQLNVERLEADFSKWQTILEGVDYMLEHSEGYKTLVIDTIDWAEQACINMLNEKHRTDNILTLDYGKGSKYVHAEFCRLLIRLDKLIEKGINVVLLAHAVMRKQELPDEMGAFDRWELKLQSGQVKAQVKEWADAVLFGNYKTLVVKDQKTKSNKAQGGKRVVYTVHTPTWDAKNRHGMPEVMDLDYEQINGYLFDSFNGAGGTVPALEPKKEKTAPEKPETAQNVQKTEEKPQKSDSFPTFTPEELKRRKEGTQKLEGIPAELKKLMIENNVTDWDIQSAVASLKNAPYAASVALSDYDPAFVNDMLINKWDGLFKKIKKLWEFTEPPFVTEDELPFDSDKLND